MTQRFGAKLRAIRENLELTINEVESMCGIPRSTISDYESGRRVNPNLSKLSTLCSVYGVSLSSILSEHRGKSIFARASELSVESDKIDVALSKIKRFSELYQDLISLSHASELTNIQQARMYASEPSIHWDDLALEISHDMRDLLDCEYGNVINLLDYLARGKHILFFSCDLPDHVDGLFFASDDNLLFTIAINSRAPAVRQRFTIAHEYVHFLLDRNETSYICEDIFQSNAMIERRANRIASQILVPNEGLELYRSGLNKEIGYSDVIDLCCRYKVSYEMMLNRLNNVGLINSESRSELLNHDHLSDLQYRQMTNNLQRNYSDIIVDVGLDFGGEDLSSIELNYINMVARAFREGLITKRKVSEYIPSDRIVNSLNLDSVEIEVETLF